jgi:cytochrome c-type biogenesis protein CcmH/NrfG
MAMEGPVPSGPDCPSLREWGLFEAGQYSGEEATRMVGHASGCPSCGQLLADLHSDESESEMQSGRGPIMALGSNTTAWKRKMVSRIVSELGRETARSTNPSRWWTPAFAAAAAAMVVMIAGTTWWISFRNSPRTASNLIAQAYSEQRPFELRIPGANHAPLRAERGALASPAVSLLEAQQLIAKELQQRPADPAWLRVQARADLLQWRYAPAIQALQKVLETEPDDAEVSGDLGIAYLQRAELESHPQDVAPAIEYLRKAAEKAPSEPAFRFNLALAYEHQPDPRRALEEWNRYLALDMAGPWADEAREHVNKLKK